MGGEVSGHEERALITALAGQACEGSDMTIGHLGESLGGPHNGVTVGGVEGVSTGGNGHIVSVPALVVDGLAANDCVTVGLAVRADLDARSGVPARVRSGHLDPDRLKTCATKAVTECDPGSSIHLVRTGEEEARLARNEVRSSQDDRVVREARIAARREGAAGAG